MVFTNTLVKVADNSGASVVKCVHIINKFRCGKVGNLILVTVFKYLHSKKVKKKNFYMGLLVCTTHWSFRREGFYIRFGSNKVLLFSLQLRFVGTKVIGLLDKLIRYTALVYKDTKFIYKMFNFSCKLI